MTSAPEPVLLSPRHALWHAYDPPSKSELFSTAIADPAGRLLIVDPIPLKEARTGLASLGTPSAIVVTNENHWRAAAQFSTEFQVPIFTAAASELPGPIQPIDDLPKLFDGLTTVSIEGAAQGEIALHFSHDDEGIVIVGDSLIHFDPYGLALLPKKYCRHQDKMRQSLKQLLSLRFGRLFFAHGLPILNQTMPRLQALLDHE